MPGIIPIKTSEPYDSIDTTPFGDNFSAAPLKKGQESFFTAG
jgi:hypothetical protein